MGALSKSLKTAGFLVFSAVYATPASGLVRLELADNDATPTSTTVLPGASFTVTARLVSTQASEQITGADYYLSVSGAAAGKFRITGRATTGSSFPDLIKGNNGDNGSNPGVLDAAFAVLNPRNALDLGGSVANVNAPNPGNSSYLLAFYTISVPVNTPNGTYTLSTLSEPGTGWVGAAPLFNEQAFAQHGQFSVTVQAAGGSVPEPTGALAVAGAMALGRRRRR
jgi:MYXO-CTERM domain-containing protein